ncbi:hypothetical protein CNR34_00152 [Pseudomonas phage nickie]|uniref:Uncharacterized protein n=1 Tax=Pseudomonas phage nickie TaxID=2048977 RepID=A0A2H4P7D4_9CAUD|nr:hypothetical protein FDJ16_gp013 [Pseudomonas phage nickie]ATW58085.1 hypothetical protein CNR34_00152 [Pseudomonas phage nickie]
MNQQENARRLQALFEHCARNVIKSTPLPANFDRNEDGTFKSPITEDLYALWLSGHGQGVADHAVARGDVEL